MRIASLRIADFAPISGDAAEEVAQPDGLQDWASTLAENTRGIRSATAATAMQMFAVIIQFGDAAAAYANEQWARFPRASKSSAKPAQRD